MGRGRRFGAAGAYSKRRSKNCAEKNQHLFVYHIPVADKPFLNERLGVETKKSGSHSPPLET
jgi:hypothetical protein